MIDPIDPSELAAARARSAQPTAAEALFQLDPEVSLDDPTTPSEANPAAAPDGQGLPAEVPLGAGEPATAPVEAAPAADVLPRPTPTEPALSYATAPARLLAEGWPCPVPELVLVIRQAETLRAGIKAMSAIAANDPNRIGGAVRNADTEEFIAAVTANAISAWLDSQVGTPSSQTYQYNYAIQADFERLVHSNQRKLLGSLEGFDTPAAEAMRNLIARMDGVVRLSPPSQSSALIYR